MPNLDEQKYIDGIAQLFPHSIEIFFALSNNHTQSFLSTPAAVCGEIGLSNDFQIFPVIIKGSRVTWISMYCLLV